MIRRKYCFFVFRQKTNCLFGVEKNNVKVLNHWSRITALQDVFVGYGVWLSGYSLCETIREGRER